MEPPSQHLNQILTILKPSIAAADYATVAVCVFAILILIGMSAMIAGSENAFFSLSKTQADELTDDKTLTAIASQFLLKHPKKLLATILIGNTFVNIAVVMVSGLMFSMIFDFGEYAGLEFLFEIVFVTFTIVLFGEVMPKIYASQNNIQVARILAVPMFYLSKLLAPFIWILVKSTSVIDKRITKKGHILSVNELTHAIEITNETDTPKEEKIILKSIVNFGSINVKQIMKQRPDISSLEFGLKFHDILDKINRMGYSRIPIYKDNLDNITGILYTKDLLPHIHKDNDFKWTSLIRKPYFVPESKKIDNLLKEFQSKRVHLALVVDEYGGTCGLVTMDDILEEIFGEINDEFDEEENVYSKINDNTYVFEAKIPILDMCKFMDINVDEFEEIRNEADTLGGMLLELSEELPDKGEEIIFNQFTFLIESVDKRKIKRVKVTIHNSLEENEN